VSPGKERTGVPTYLVERYWPGVTIERLLEALERACGVMEEMSDSGTHLRHINSVLLPGEEVVFSVYDGPSAAAVGELNERAGIPVSRIVDAIAMTED
jgi:Nickel responsive protein SCO4226-like